MVEVLKNWLALMLVGFFGGVGFMSAIGVMWLIKTGAMSWLASIH